jgi:thioredoxin-related protein
MKNVYLLLLAILVGFSSNSQIKRGSSMPLSEQQFLDVKTDSKIALKSHKLDKGLVVVFSCNTCPFVVGTPDFPGWEIQYNNLYDQAIKQNIGFVLVNSNEKNRQIGISAGADSDYEMRKHAEEKGYQMPYLLDEKSILANAFEAKTTPHVFLFNSQLKLVYSGSIDNIWDNKRTKDIPYLANAMKALNQGKKIKPSATPPKGCSIKRFKN